MSQHRPTVHCRDSQLLGRLEEVGGAGAIDHVHDAADAAETAQQRDDHGHDPDRQRKLLLNRAEIDKLDQRVAQGSLTIVPLRLYWKGGRAKIELGLAKGRTKGDKRQHMAERDADREIQTEFNRANKYGDAHR